MTAVRHLAEISFRTRSFTASKSAARKTSTRKSSTCKSSSRRPSTRTSTAPTLVAWAVAYALVLQALLTGFALAAMPVGMDPTLCLGAASADTGANGGDDGALPQHQHCLACLARADLPALPPPAPAPEAAALIGALRLHADAPPAPARAARPNAFQARAPPRCA